MPTPRGIPRSSLPTPSRGIPAPSGLPTPGRGIPTPGIGLPIPSAGRPPPRVSSMEDIAKNNQKKQQKRLSMSGLKPRSTVTKSEYLSLKRKREKWHKPTHYILHLRTTPRNTWKIS